MSFHLLCIWPVKRIKSSCFLSRLNRKNEWNSISFLFFFHSFDIVYRAYIVMNTKHIRFLISAELFMLHVCSKYLSLCIFHFRTLGLYVLFLVLLCHDTLVVHRCSLSFFLFVVFFTSIYSLYKCVRIFKHYSYMPMPFTCYRYSDRVHETL